MKKLRIYLVFLALTAFAISSGCKKNYALNLPDGYDKPHDPTGASVDTISDKTDSSMYNKARIFPGLVDNGERLIADTTVSFNLNYNYVSASKLGVAVVPQPVFSSGLYAGAGVLIEIDVPANVYGLTVQIGEHTDNLTGLVPSKREPIIYTVKALAPGKNHIRNLFGGYILVKSDVSIQTAVNLTFKKVYRSPDFVLGQSNVSSWKSLVLASKVPWLELRSAHTSFAVQTSLVARAITNGGLNDIDQALTKWDNIFSQDIYNWIGFTQGNSDNAYRSPELQERFVMDIQLTNGYYTHNGQPIVVQNGTPFLNEWTTLNTIITAASTGTLNEISANYLLNRNPYWSGITETMADLLRYNIAKRNNAIPTYKDTSQIARMFPLALNFAAKPGGKYLSADPYTSDAVFKMTPLAQLIDKITNPATGQSGYYFFPYVVNKAKTAVLFPTDDWSRQNFFFQALCDYTQTDFSKFFDAWGMGISTYSRSYATKYPQIQKTLWTYDPISKSGGDGTVSKRIYTDRTNWIVTASNQETVKENAPATNMLDGNPDTYWHSQYNTAPAKLPWTLIFDMGQTNTVTGFYIAARYSSRRPQRVILAVSNDGVTWTENVITFSMQNVPNNQFFTLAANRTFRYFKLTLPDPSWDTIGATVPNNAIAEVGTFFDPL